VGPYEIVARIGAGGMGEVFRARDPRLGREVAIKVIAADIAADPQAVARFEREARAVARLSHPNILAIHDVGQQGDTTYAVMELLQGEPLRRRVLAGPVPVRKAVDIATHIARGLAAAHEAGIVHRDLKPENVFLTADGQVKILDFGLARTPPSADESHAVTALGVAEVTARGTALGTPGYMAPEQVQGRTCDQRSDIFALGAVLYELLTGRRAFRGESSVDVMHAVLREEPDASMLAAVPGTLRRLTLRCLEKRPEDRFGSARDVSFALEAAADSESGSAVVLAPARHAGSRTAVVMSAFAALSVVAALVWMPWRADRSSQGHRVASSWRYAMSVPGMPAIWAFSPDGRRLAALMEGETRSDPEDLGAYSSALWVRDAADSGWRQVAPSNNPTAAYLSALAWAPDGKSVAYHVVSRGSPELRVVDVGSGAVRPLAQVASPQGMAWSAASGILTGGTTLRLVAADTGAVTDVLPADATITWRRWPSYLPDGRSFVFTQNGREERQRGIFLGRVGSPTISRVFASVSNAVVTRSGYLLFGYRGSVMGARLDAAGGTIVGEPQQLASRLPTFWGFTWFAISPDDTLLTPQEGAAGVPIDLTVFNRDGRTLRTIGSADAYRQIELSPDARQLAVERHSGLAVVDIAQGTLTPVTEAQLTGPPSSGWSDRASLPRGFVDPVWSPDGRALAAAMAVEERFGDLVLIDINSREVRPLLTGPGLYPEAWSKEGTQILLTRPNQEGTGRHISVVSVASSSNGRSLTRSGPYVADDPQLSPDGRWLSYTSNETGTWEVYVQGFNPPQARRRISPSGGVQTRWSDDGKELFYLRLDGTLMSVAINSLGETVGQTPLFKVNSAPDFIRNEFVVLPGARQFIGLVPTTSRPAPPSLSALINATSILPK
jgi:eukaryotic-like serine/threonine-protein kinase